MTARYNSFNQIHKGLRTLLYETAMDLQQTDMADATAGSEVIEQLREVLFLFESHAHGEDHFFNEPLEKLDSKISELFLKEHEEDHRLGRVLEDLIQQWENQNTETGRREVGRDLFYAFNEFIAFNLYHMNKEELQLNAALWFHFSDEQIKGIEQTLVQQVPPAKMAKYIRWMVRGINDTELAHWAHEVQQFAPAPVFQLLDDTAAKELPANRYETLQENLRKFEVAKSSVL